MKKGKLLLASILSLALFLGGCGENRHEPEPTSQQEPTSQIVVEKKLASISVISGPTKNEYFVEESIDLGGAKLQVAYTDGTIEIIDISQSMCTDFKWDEVGVHTVKVNYSYKNESKEASFSVNVVEHPAKKIESIDLGVSLKILYVGDTCELEPNFTPSDTKKTDVIWKSSDSTIAKVNENGVITAVATGNVTITATSKENDKVVSTMRVYVYKKSSGGGGGGSSHTHNYTEVVEYYYDDTNSAFYVTKKCPTDGETNSIEISSSDPMFGKLIYESEYVKFVDTATYSTAKSIQIKTSEGQKLYINAPYYNVTHIGEAKNVDITAVYSSSYHGKADISEELIVRAGRVVLEGTANVGKVSISPDDEVSLELSSNAKIGLDGIHVQDSSEKDVSINIQGTNTSNGPVAITGTKLKELKISQDVKLNAPVEELHYSKENLSVEVVNPANIISQVVNETTDETKKIKLYGEKVTDTNVGSIVTTGGDNVVRDTMVAYVHMGIYYPTLEAAITAASENGKILLNKDITLSSTLIVGKNITIDLNGHTVSGTNSLNDYLIKVEANKALTLMNSIAVGSVYDPRDNIKGTITAVEVLGTLNVNENVKVERKAGIAVKVDENGEEVRGTLNLVPGGTIVCGDGTDGQAIQNWSTLNITGGTIVGDVDTWAYSNFAGTTTISGATITGAVKSIQLKYSNAWPTVAAQTTIGDGNTISGHLCAEYRTGLQPAEVVSIQESVTNPILIVDGIKFAATELEKDAANSTYKLHADTELVEMAALDNDLTLDLNGKTLSLRGDSAHTAKVLEVINDATLTIVGSVDNSKFYGRINIGRATNNNGNVIINGGTYEVGSDQTVLHINGDCLDSDVTIDNAKITSANDNAVQLNGSGTFLIKNSTLTGGTGLYIKSGTTTIINSTITGTLSPADYSYYGNGAYATGDAIVIDACNYPGGNPNVTIESGTFTGSKGSIGYYQHKGKDAELGTATIEVKGGSFSTLPNIEWIKSGAEIKLAKDVALTSTYNIDKNLTLDLNGHNVTATGVRALWVKKGNVVIKNTGGSENTVSADGDGLGQTSSVIRVGDPNDDTVDANLTVGTNVKVTTQKSFGVSVFGKNKAELVVDGKVEVSSNEAAVSGNGSTGLGETKITINGSVKSTNDYAIYHPQAGTLNINGTVEGKGGIEIKSGSVLTAGNSAVIKATAASTSHSKNNDGTSTSGYAIAVVENPGYAGNAQVTINSGATIEGEIDIIQDAAVEETKKATITINGGNFTILPKTEYIVEGAEIKLAKDVALTSTYNIDKNLTLDLNGHNVTATGVRAFYIKSGVVEFKNTVDPKADAIIRSTGIASNSSVIRLGDGSTYEEKQDAPTAKLTIGENVDVKSSCSYGITVFGSDTEEVLIVNGKVTVTDVETGAIGGNGNDKYTFTHIEINGTVTSEKDYAIYHPQLGELIVNGTVKGLGGIEMKAGAVLSTGDNAKIEATADTQTHVANGNGTSTSGYAIAVVENAGYGGYDGEDMGVIIRGGEYKGIIDILDDDSDATNNKAAIYIFNGKFSVLPKTEYLVKEATVTLLDDVKLSRHM